MTNAQIAKLLRNVAASYLIKDERKFHFQIVAYQRAADAIDNTTTELYDLFKEGRLQGLPGIGSSISQHIEELFTTGKSKQFEWAMEGIPKSVFKLMEVPGFGPKKAYRLTKKFNLHDEKTVIDDIFTLAKKGNIAPLEGFGEKSQADIIRVVEEFKKGYGKATRMALPFAGELAEKIVAYLKENKAVKQVDYLGSLRRMRDTIGDVDIAVATDDPTSVIEHFAAYPYKERIIEQGTMSSSIITTGGKQVDLLTVPPKNYGSLLQHFTGSKNHNVHLREIALKQGMSLSERGIKRKKNGKEILDTYSTEEAFYKAIGLDWIPPELREDAGEIERALRSAQGKPQGLPHLVELKDIKGDLHIHSNFPVEPSHDLGHDSMEEMLEKANELGYEYLGFSEHNPSVSKHTDKQIYSLLEKKKEKIEHINKSKKYIRVINLMETDILVNGSIALNDEQLSLLDATIVSIHSSFAMNKKDMTKRIIQGLSHPKAKIFAHPTGRLINERPGYDVDFDKLFDFCAKHNKALEINSWPSRLDLSDIMVHDAIKHGVTFVINTDSHAIPHMDLMKYGVSVARRGWAEKKDILNALPYVEFMKWLKNEK